MEILGITYPRVSFSINEKVASYLNYYRGKYDSSYTREESEAIGLGAQLYTGNSFYIRTELNYLDHFDNGIGDPSYQSIDTFVAIETNGNGNTSVLDLIGSELLFD